MLSECIKKLQHDVDNNLLNVQQEKFISNMYIQYLLLGDNEEYPIEDNLKFWSTGWYVHTQLNKSKD